MNEQIEKLARQVEACYIPRYDMWQMDSETMKKFAELIVKECARVAFESDLTMAIGQWGADSAILKHFGVEK